MKRTAGRYSATLCFDANKQAQPRGALRGWNRRRGARGATVRQALGGVAATDRLQTAAGRCEHQNLPQATAHNRNLPKPTFKSMCHSSRRSARTTWSLSQKMTCSYERENNR